MNPDCNLSERDHPCKAQLPRAPNPPRTALLFANANKSRVFGRITLVAYWLPERTHRSRGFPLEGHRIIGGVGLNGPARSQGAPLSHAADTGLASALRSQACIAR